ncbi:MAG: hypothetical protein WKF87_20605 [Chryseolinea sp.]
MARKYPAQNITIILFTLLCGHLVGSVNAQVKIGNNPNVIDANSILELESTNKGFLPPRVALNSFNLVTPLTGTVPAGMLVYSTGGTLANGYYYWSGSQWIAFISPGVSSIVSKTATATLLKSENFVVASNDITLTLPAITAADNGLSMTVKNVGTHLHQVDVVPSGSSTIDDVTISKHFRWMARTYIASGGNWIIQGNDGRTDNVFDVSATGSWTTIEEVIEFLGVHMVATSVVRLIGGDYPIAATQTIALLYPLTIQGSSYGAATVSAAPGLSGAMFICQSESYFKMLAFDGGAIGVDAIRLATSSEYYEVKDCTFDDFSKAIVMLANVELWVFEVDITNATTAGIELAGTSAAIGLSFKISETDFIGCAVGINFVTGTNAIISILNCGFYNATGTGTGISYAPGASTTFKTMFITNNTWNNEGVFMGGFDFSRTDGRDANAFIRNNSGGPDKNPHCRINVNNNVSTTPIAVAGTWVKALWSSQTSTTTKWLVETNKITYQPLNKSDGWAMITGNITVPSNNRTISIAIVKNGATVTRFGETDLRISTATNASQFATTIYLTDIRPGDYFELYCTSGTSGETTTFQDVQWFMETK